MTKPNPVEALRAWTKNNSCALPIEEIRGTLEAYDKLSNRLEEAEMLLSKSEAPWPVPSFYAQTIENNQWRKRRDAFLKTHQPKDK